MKRTAILALLLAGFAAPARAELPSYGDFVFPKVIQRRNPSYPTSALMHWKEGWVEASFCIDAQGNSHDPVIERSSGLAVFEEAVLKVLPDWKYEPPTLNGEPIEICDVPVRLTFSVAGRPLGARPQFAKQWRAASRLIDAGDAAGAQVRIEALTPENNYESARMHFARARIAEKRGDARAEFEEMQSALRFSNAIERSLKRDAKRRSFHLAIKLGLWADALALYEELKKDRAEVSDAERAAGEELVALVNGDRALATDAELTCRCDAALQSALWETRLLRREFGFRDARGRIERFQVRCQRRRFGAPFEADKSWTVPASWGECRLYVFGDEGAKVQLIEYASEGAKDPAPADGATATRSR